MCKLSFSEAHVYFSAAVKTGKDTTKIFEDSQEYTVHSLDGKVSHDGNNSGDDIWTDCSRKDMESFFYDCAINAIYPDGKLKKEKYFKDIKHYSRKVDSKVKVSIKNNAGSQEIDVTRVHYFLFPSNILLFSFECNFKNIPADAYIDACSAFRDIEHWVYDDGTPRISPEGLSLFDDIVKLHNSGRSEKIEIGDYGKYYTALYKFNKLKIYSNIVIPKNPDFKTGYNMDNLLFEAATCSPFGSSSDKSNRFCPSENYFTNTIEENTLSVFNDWKSLILTDSIVSVHIDDGHHRKMWERFYYEYIYVGLLFVKTYTLEMTDRFKNSGNDPESLGTEFNSFDKAFNFNNVSFNFLPQLLYIKIREILSIDRELDWIKNRIDQYNSQILAKRVALLTAAQIFFLTISFFGINYTKDCNVPTWINVIAGLSVMVYFLFSIFYVLKIIWNYFRKCD